MSKNLTKFVISCFILILLIGSLVYIATNDIDLGFLRIWSISSITSRYDEVKQKEETLLQRENTYKNTLRNLESAKVNFNQQKTKYEAISNETINMIKEATTEENYDIEYMWVKLGNYARTNNLQIVLIEPGGSASIENKAEDTKTEDTNNTVSSTSSSNPTETEQNASTTITSTDALQIQFIGSYLNVADFVFDVENDKELRFRLDNISMDYVEGTTIKTTFDVKNLTINK